VSTAEHARCAGLQREPARRAADDTGVVRFAALLCGTEVVRRETPCRGRSDVLEWRWRADDDPAKKGVLEFVISGDGRRGCDFDNSAWTENFEVALVSHAHEIRADVFTLKRWNRKDASSFTLERLAVLEPLEFGGRGTGHDDFERNAAASDDRLPEWRRYDDGRCRAAGSEVPGEKNSTGLRADTIHREDVFSPGDNIERHRAGEESGAIIIGNHGSKLGDVRAGIDCQHVSNPLPVVEKVTCPVTRRAPAVPDRSAARFAGVIRLAWLLRRPGARSAAEAVGTAFNDVSRGESVSEIQHWSLATSVKLRRYFVAPTGLATVTE
jgi:hypothetical protein